MASELSTSFPFFPTLESYVKRGARKFTIYWRIENFNREPCNNFCIFSETFLNKSMKSVWQIKLDVATGQLCAYLLKKTINRKRFNDFYSISLLTRSGWISICENLTFKVDGDDNGNKIIDLKKLKEDERIYVPDGSLTVSFQIWNYSTVESFQSVMVSRLRNETDLCHRPHHTFSTLKPNGLFPFPFCFERRDKAMASLNNQNIKEIKAQHTQSDTNINVKDADDLRKLFTEKEFSFVTLRTPTKEFFVHKAVLCAKSPVFNAMFERRMKETNSNVVDIDDIDSQIMSLFIKYLHYEPLGDLKWSDAVSLYSVAARYQIDSLRKESASLLNRELSDENICDLLVLADLHQDDDLMNYAQEYFCMHSKAILTSTQWRVILDHTELVAKVLSKLAKSRL
ncbi:uncharacterized protein [Parasteatoda tepidariorum]|uniref:uncharacterized protein isoform X1 n=1 Tax=Parasteatoda tepidariorum TaxID=114398 RepID=UPI001C71BBC0|nr:uncharacterized protein LOC107438409 isoform X1 [Parasteatoda tepidariorum]